MQRPSSTRPRPLACLELARLCLEGKGVKSDAARVLALLERAQLRARFGLDASRVCGGHVPVEPLRAARLLDEAQDSVETDAYEPLGDILTTPSMAGEPCSIALRRLQQSVDGKVPCGMTALGMHFCVA